MTVNVDGWPIQLAMLFLRGYTPLKPPLEHIQAMLFLREHDTQVGCNESVNKSYPGTNLTLDLVNTY